MPASGKLPIGTARLNWEDGVPIALNFDDPYFSKQSGIEETRYVFLHHNALTERLSQPADDNPNFSIGETGFGTGLNFLCAWQLRDEINKDCWLHFTSYEKFPLTLSDLKQALKPWQNLNHYAEQLLAVYPALTPGWHRLSFIAAKVNLNLYLGDLVEGLGDNYFQADAWFLDGFAPAKNPEMWSSAVYQQISRLSKKGTSFATFTAARSVNEGLTDVGFNVEKITGFGRKRHMLKGVLTAADTQFNNELSSATPWYLPPRPLKTKQRKAIVVGAGLAGATVAHSLAKRGWHVTVLEQHDAPAQGASGNSQGIIYNKISAEPSIRSDFYTAGYLYSLQQIHQIMTVNGQPVDWSPCGVLQLPSDEKDKNRQQQLLACNPQPSDVVYPVDAVVASSIAGIRLDQSGLFYPSAGWVDVAKLCHSLLSHPLIDLQCGIPVSELSGDSQDWTLTGAGNNTIAQAPVVIVANGYDAGLFEQHQHLPLKSIRGQVTHLDAGSIPRLKTVVCGKAYIAPPSAHQYLLGATFNLDSHDKACRDADHLDNLTQIKNLVPNLFPDSIQGQELLGQVISGRVGFRCTSPDYLPLVGPAPDQHAYLRDYAPLRKDAKTRSSKAGTYHAGLYLSVAHGSKGLTSCSLAAEILASQICNEAAPVSQKIAQALHPARFIIRDLIRNKI